MSATNATHHTLLDTVWRDRTLQRNLILMVAGSLLLTLSAKVQVPFYPVPMTMQTLVVMLIGFAFGWRLGGATVLFYLAQGAMGLPVFAGGAGVGYMMGTTGGYLLGFFIAALLCGFLAERRWDRNPVGIAVSMVLATAIIYALGVGWLGSIIGWDKPVLEYGMLPFLYGDLLKVVLGVALLSLGWNISRR